MEGRKKPRCLLLSVLIVIFVDSCRSNFVFSASNSAHVKSISMPALGRPFNLGDLYDRKHDVIIQGPKLWTYEETERFAQVKTHGTKFEISSTEKVDDSMNKFDISASLKTSFMSGMVSVSGSAAYLKDKKRKNNQARVSLKYSSTTFMRSLLPDLFTKVSYPDVLRQATSATDVVVAIQYGAGAVFVFDRDIKQNEHRSSIEGHLEVAVRNIPSFSIEGSGKVKISEEQKKNMEKFSCKFHGDFVLKDHPGNYEEAIRVYKELPSLLGSNYENSVPVKVWLYPIDKLPLSIHTVKVQELEQGMITSVTEKIEELEDFVRQCNDMIDTQVASNHERIKRHVMNLKHKIEEYIIVFKEKLVDLIPQIREGKLMSGELSKLIEEKENSPFNSPQLRKLIATYAEEVKVLTSIENLPNYCKDDGDFSAKLINDRQYMIGLVMQLSERQDEYLQAMDQHLSTRQFVQSPDLITRPKWWKVGSNILRELQKLSHTLEKYHSLEKSKIKSGLQSNVEFYVREQMVEDAEKGQSVFLELYENGKLKEARFSIPSEAGKPTITSVTDNQISSSWLKPTEAPDQVVSYVASVYVRNGTTGQTPCYDSQMCLVHKNRTATNSITVHNLSPQTEYFIQVATYGQFGKTADSLMSDVMLTSKCLPGAYLSAELHCNGCPPGSYADAYDSAYCNKCPRGMYSDSYSSKECKKCPAGHFSEVIEGATECERCPSGTYGRTTGAQSRVECASCQSGSYNPHPGQSSSSSCKQCTRGTYNPNVREQQCSFCPFGTQSSVLGAKSVGVCKASRESQSVMDNALKEMSSLLQRNINTMKASVQRSKQNLAKFQKTYDSLGANTAYLQKELAAIKEDIAAKTACSEWESGEGRSSKEIFVGKAKSKMDCIKRCVDKKKSVSDINGVSMHSSDLRCWCQQSMTRIADAYKIQTCRLS